MAATSTVPDRPELRNLAAAGIPETLSGTPARLTSRYGVITLSGYGIDVRVERGHLILKDGVGNERREGRFARVNHGIERLVVIGADGVVSLAALRWLADQRASFCMLDRDGSVLVATGPVSASDARMRRAQACVSGTEASIEICCDLISRKLSGQEQVAQEKLHDAKAAKVIAEFNKRLAASKTVADVRWVESQGSAAYWSAWRNLSIEFPKSDLKRVPDHWREFGSRTSPVSTGARSAANPANAMLNYLYTVLEAETRLTVAALGLDPGLGLLHIDKPNRDSLACDLMEPIRPSVDAFLLDWLMRSPMNREWFFEQRDGTCRLMPALAARLGESARQWRREVAPFAEWFAEAVCSASPNSSRLTGPRTRLTRRHWKEAIRRDDPAAPKRKMPRPQIVCQTCGAVISSKKKYCKACAVAASTKALVEGARAGRTAALSPEALARRRASSQRQNEALLAWNPADHPSWLTNDVFISQVQPRLAAFSRPAIAAVIGMSVVYAGEIRNGNCVPHKRHWAKLAELVGISSTQVPIS